MVIREARGVREVEEVNGVEEKSGIKRVREYGILKNKSKEIRENSVEKVKREILTEERKQKFMNV